MANHGPLGLGPAYPGNTTSAVAGAYGSTATPTSDYGYSTNKRITHIEIRRVQNGFVLMCFDLTVSPQISKPPLKAAYIAQDMKALLTLIENFTTTAELDWQPSVDLPVTELFAGP